MKRTLQTLFAVCILMVALSSAVCADQTRPMPQPDNSSAELNRIKSLTGRWATTTSMFGKENQRVYTEFKVTAGGSAVEERIFPGTPQEMISVYYDDNHGKLAMTHYCMMRNRPILTLASSSADTITLKVSKVEGLKSKDDASMGGTSIHFKDKNHFESTCGGRGKGTKDQKPITMEYTRVK